MEAGDPNLREMLIGPTVRRDELAREVADQPWRIASDEPAITPEKVEKVERLGLLLRDRLQRGSGEPRQAHARLVIGEVTANERKIRIGGSKAVLARCATEPPGETSPAVLSFVQEWRTRQDQYSTISQVLSTC